MLHPDNMPQKTGFFKTKPPDPLPIAKKPKAKQIDKLDRMYEEFRNNIGRFYILSKIELPITESVCKKHLVSELNKDSIDDICRYRVRHYNVEINTIFQHPKYLM